MTQASVISWMDSSLSQRLQSVPNEHFLIVVLTLVKISRRELFLFTNTQNPVLSILAHFINLIFSSLLSGVEEVPPPIFSSHQGFAQASVGLTYS